MPPRHVGGGPGLIDEHQALGIERRLARNKSAARLGYVGTVLLGGVQALFVSVICCARTNRDRLVGPNAIPRRADSAARFSRKLRSGGSAISSDTARAVVAPHGTGFGMTFAPQPLRPAHRRADADPEATRCRPRRRAGSHGGGHSIAQIPRIGCRHIVLQRHVALSLSSIRPRGKPFIFSNQSDRKPL
jgi:hypothetical protein